MDEHAGIHAGTGAAFRRRRQLCPPVGRSALLGIAPTPCGTPCSPSSCRCSSARWRRSSSIEIPAARLPARHLRHADDGDARGDRAGVDHDVPSAARRSELSSVAGRHSGAGMDIQSEHRHSLAGRGGDVAMDAAGHADRAGRAGLHACASRSRARRSTAPMRGSSSATSPCR